VVLAKLRKKSTQFLPLSIQEMHTIHQESLKLSPAFGCQSLLTGSAIANSTAGYSTTVTNTAEGLTQRFQQILAVRDLDV